MSDIARRGAYESGNLMTVLKFCTVDFDESVGFPEQDLRRGFNNVCFSRASRSQEQ